MNLLQPDLSPPESDFPMLIAELEALKKEQMEGKWKPEAKLEAQTPDDFEVWVSSRIRRGVELTTILRRSNTGPANSKKKPSKKAANMEAVKAALLG